METLDGVKFCGLVFPKGQPPRHLLPPGVVFDGTKGGGTLPTKSSDIGAVFMPVGRARDFVGSSAVVPYLGFFLATHDGWEDTVLLVNEIGKEHAARIFIFKLQETAREEWLGLLAFEDDESSMNLARNCRDLRLPLPREMVFPPEVPGLN